MQKFNCKTCGAELQFDPVSGKLKCDYCGSTFMPEEFNTVTDVDASEASKANADTSEVPKVDATIPEEVDENTKSTDESEGDLVVYKCSNCGAEVITSRNTAATTCVFCNRNITLEGNLSGALKPDYVIPFSKTKEDVERAYTDLCKRSFLTPKLFRKESTVKKIKGMYVPFWMHSMHAVEDLDADASNIRVWKVGDTEYTETTRYHINQTAGGDFDKVATDALVKMDNQMMDAIEPFDYNELKPFSPGYLAGFYTERFDEDAQVTMPRAKERIAVSLHEKIMSGIDTYGSMHINSQNVTWSNEKSEYGMLPVWMMYTEYRGKNYIFGMNGQTGKMIGEIPKDYGKAALIAGAIFVGSQIVMMVMRLIGGLL